MQRLLDQAANLIREAREQEAGQSVGNLQESVALLEAIKPGKERDGMMALAYLRLAQAHGRMGQKREAERSFMIGYSYARTSREERVRRLAEKMVDEFQPSV